MKSTYVLAAVLMALLIMTNFIYTRVDLYSLLGMTRTDVVDLQEEGTSVQGYRDSFMAGFDAGRQASESIQEGTAGFKILGEGPFYREDVATIFALDTGALYNLLLLAIFSGLFVGEIYSSGLDKNLMAFGGRRGVLYSARILVVTLYSLILHAVTLISAIVSMAMMGEGVYPAFDKAFVIYFIVTWLLTASFSCVVGVMSHLTRSKAAGITLGIILSTGALSTIISIATLILQRRLGLSGDFNLGYYTMTMNISALTLYSDGHFVLRAIICALAYFATAYAAGLCVIRKRDIS